MLSCVGEESVKNFISHESYYQCDCGYEALLLRQYSWDSKPEPQVEIAIFSQSCRCKTWKEQIRWIWHIICNKQIWSDQIILNAEEMERLGNTLLMLSKHIKEDNGKEA